MLIKWPNLIPYSKLQKYVFTVLLLTLTPLGTVQKEKPAIEEEVKFPINRFPLSFQTDSNLGFPFLDDLAYLACLCELRE